MDEVRRVAAKLRVLVFGGYVASGYRWVKEVEMGGWRVKERRCSFSRIAENTRDDIF